MLMMLLKLYHCFWNRLFWAVNLGTGKSPVEEICEILEELSGKKSMMKN